MSIEEWKSLAASDPKVWSECIQNSITNCVGRTGTAVISQRVENVSLESEDGSLAGVPYALKDLFHYRGLPTHCSSVMPDLQYAQQGDADIVTILAENGASCVAKTQMNEFAYGLSGENPHYGNCPHPFLENCLTGGSSSGSAHIVSAGYFPVAIGTDTGGSIRVPAAWCGIYGLRLAARQWSGGAYPLARSLDSVGWFTKSNTDMQYMIDALLSGSEDGREPVGCALIPKELVYEETSVALQKDLSSFDIKCNKSLHLLADKLAYSNKAFNILQSKEAFALHRHRLAQYGDLYDPAVRARLLRGANWTSEEQAWAQLIQMELNAWFEDYFSEYDYLLLPAVPCPAISADQASDELREKMLRLTAPASLTGKPVLTIPVSIDDHGRTVGWQVICNNTNASLLKRILAQYASQLGCM